MNLKTLSAQDILNSNSDVKIVSRVLNSNGELEIVIQQKSNAMYACYPPRPAPDRVLKETYWVKDGKIALKDKLEGTHTPQYIVKEQITFE